MSGAQAAPLDQGETSLYLVQTIGQPVSTYEGAVAGFARTKPSTGDRVDTNSHAAGQWRQKLRNDHDSALKQARVNGSAKVYDYGVTFNGFAARLTKAEAQRLKSNKDVIGVWEDEIVYADTTTTRDFLGLSGRKGVWEKEFHGDKRAGEGVIVGVLDSGVWAENPSFAPLRAPRDQAIIDAKWKGSCDTGPEQPVSCNNKLIGAQHFRAGGQGSIEETEFFSARDRNGHGSHTSSTAAGNFGVPVSMDGYNLGTASGVAPAARIAMYKVLWHVSASNSASGSGVDIVAAIDKAVADGVDVINYSISGATNVINRTIDVAFFNAVAAGVFVSASAGNSGAASTVNHNAPWLTTVAASTHDRGNRKPVTLGNGTSYVGVGVNPPSVASAPLVDSESIPAAGRTPADARLCLLGSINAAAAAGKVVICTRGNNARVEKSQVVRDAGGVGVVLANTAVAESINGDWHFLPTVHVGPDAGSAIKAYAATAGATAAIGAVDPAKVRAAEMAGFSSYGPAVAGGGDLLKPDLTAPGSDVIAASSPPGTVGRDFDFKSGTSMSSPHVAGLAALLKSKNPSWSPMWIKSALMTTASTKDNTGQPIQGPGGNATPLHLGAGHIVPSKAFDPGLVYDSGPQEWLQYGCALGQFQAITVPGTCESLPALDPSDLNYPSISVGDLVGSQTITRTVTNVAKLPGIYRAKVTAPAGFKVKVTPDWLVLLPGRSATFKVEITRTTAALGAYAFGSLTWDELILGNRQVTSPIAVRPVPFSSPGTVQADSGAGSVGVTVQTGYAGTLNATLAGLAPAQVSELAFTATSQSFPTGAPAEGPGAKKVTVTVPAGSAHARFALYDADVPAGTDIDIYAYRAGTNQLVGASAGGSSAEEINLTAAGNYDVYVVMFDYDPALPAIPSAKHHAYVVPAAASGNATLTPASAPATIGGRPVLTLAWSGLADVRHLGIVSFNDGTTALGRSFVLVN